MKQRFSLLFLLVSSLCLHANTPMMRVWSGVSERPVVHEENAHQVYVIDSPEKLSWVSDSVEKISVGDTVRLSIDISIDTLTWHPIGSAVNPFVGYFDGGYHMITGLRNFDVSENVGLFGYVGSEGEVNKLGIWGDSIQFGAGINAGSLIGTCEGIVRECWTMASMSSNGGQNIGGLGGLVGVLKGGRLENVYSQACITSPIQLYNTGVLVGNHIGGTISYAYAAGFPQWSGPDESVGLFVGKTTKTIASFDHCGVYAPIYSIRACGEGKVDIPTIQEVGDFVEFFEAKKSQWSTSSSSYPVLVGFANSKVSNLARSAVKLSRVVVQSPHNEPLDGLKTSFSLPIGYFWSSNNSVIQIQRDDKGKTTAYVTRCNNTPSMITMTDSITSRSMYMCVQRYDKLDAGSMDGEKTTKNYCRSDMSNVYLKDLIKSVKSPTGGNTDEAYRYRVCTYDNAQSVIDCIFEGTEDEFETQKDTIRINIDSVGTFKIRRSVQYCDQWVSSTGQISIRVHDFDLGYIKTGADTVLLRDGKSHAISIKSDTAAIGGGLTYVWYLKRDDGTATVIKGANADTLNYTIKEAGLYRFVRMAKDTFCHKSTSYDELRGYYQVVAMYPFDAGEVLHDKLIACDTASVEADTIKASAATGGYGKISYQWYMVDTIKHDTTIIKGATQQNLILKGIKLESNKRYIRKARHELIKEWKLSRNSCAIYVFPFTAGAIRQGVDTLVGYPDTICVASEKKSEGGDGNIKYKWDITNLETGVVETIITNNVDSLQYCVKYQGVYVFRRYAQDGLCSVSDWTQSEGEYRLLVVDSFHSGLVTSDSVYYYCDTLSAKRTDITASTASGGVPPYQYQWYAILGSDTVEVADAKGQNLRLHTYRIDAGNTYKFIRKARDSYSKAGWYVSAGSTTIHVYPSFSAGSIEPDSITCVKPCLVKISSTKGATGGDGKIEYIWMCNDSIILKGSYPDLKSYKLEKPGYYVFTRYASDGTCHNVVKGDGKYVVRVIDPFDAGSIKDTGIVYACDPNSARTLRIRTLKAPTGGVAPYKYQWYLVEGSKLSPISQTEELNLSGYKFEADKQYTFVRKVKDSSSPALEGQSAGSLTIVVRPTFEVGEIETKTEFHVGTSWKVTIGSRSSAYGGDGKIEYGWKVNDEIIPNQTGETLNGYELQGVGKYVFTRFVKDGSCYNSSLSRGTYEVNLSNTFNPGSVTTSSPLIYCKVGDTKGVTLQGSAASGGSGSYGYQWFYVIENDTNSITGATSPNLDISNISLAEGQTCTFYRKAHDVKSGEWLESAHSVVVRITMPYSSGKIEDKTIFAAVGDTIVIHSIDSARGGVSPITYSWKKNDEQLYNEKGDTLSYVFPAVGTYTFVRYAKDSYCNANPSASVGKYIVHVVSALDPGCIEKENTSFCQVVEARSHTIGSFKDAEGGSGAITYQWVMSDGSTPSILGGENSATLSLLNVPNLEEGKQYSFVRFAKDTLSGYKQSCDTAFININVKLQAGSIESGTYSTSDISQPIVVFNKEEASAGKNTVMYKWEVNGKEIPDSIGSGANLTYRIGRSGTYTFVRYARDLNCNTNFERSVGEYVVVVYDPFSAGAIYSKDTVFCSLTDAQAYTIGSVLPAQGGDTTRYDYLWRIKDGLSDPTDIPNSNRLTLSLGDLTLSEGVQYEFTRYAKDKLNNYFQPSKGKVRVLISKGFDAGSIHTGCDTICKASPILWSVSNKEVATGGNNIKYQWYSLENGVETPLQLQNDSILSDYQLTQTHHLYVFIRKASDNVCSPDWVASAGRDSVYVMDNLYPGAFRDTNVILCSLQSPYTLKLQYAATGGSGRYEYKWYMIDEGGQSREIVGSVGPELVLEKGIIPDGGMVRFYRMTKDDTRYTRYTSSVDTVTVRVMETFSAGAINYPNHDTICSVPYILNLSETAAAKSGDPSTLSYRWMIEHNGVKENIPEQSQANLYNVRLEKAETYIITRYVKDSCVGDFVQSVGSYQLTLLDSINPGWMKGESDTFFCSVDDAKNYEIRVDQPQGGSGSYLYEWYYVGNNNALGKGESLPLRGVHLVADSTYRFYRNTADRSYNPSAWRRSYDMKTITILPVFSSGEIYDKGFRDTILLNQPDTIRVIGMKPSSGGYEAGRSYVWHVVRNGVDSVIPGEIAESLSECIIRSVGHYEIYREDIDGLCNSKPASGKVQFVVLDGVNPGALSQPSLRYYCEQGPALVDSVEATAASGGSGKFTYQWYTVSKNGTRTRINAGTNQNLALNVIKPTFGPGDTIRLVRMVKDGYSKSTPIQSNGLVTIIITKPLNAGEIVSGRDTILGIPAHINVPNQTLATGGREESIKYVWTDNGQILLTEWNADLTDYQTSSVGLHHFRRYAYDSLCVMDTLRSVGDYYVLVREPFSAGCIGDGKNNVRTYCDTLSAQNEVLGMSPAHGGSENVAYQWFMIADGNTAVMPLEQSQQLNLKSYRFEYEKSVSFFRMAYDVESPAKSMSSSCDTITMRVTREFDAGEILNRTDTVIGWPQYVNVTSLRPARGGFADADVHYIWRKNGNIALYQSGESVVRDTIINAKRENTFVYTRWVMDDYCHADSLSMVQSDGVYTLHVLDTIDAGTITPLRRQFCDTTKARQCIITATPAKGGTGNYQYRWYLVGGGLVATTQNLDLGTMNLSMGTTYRYIRMVKDDYSLSEWKVSRDTATVSILPSFDAGAIKDSTFYVVGLPGSVTIPSMVAATGGYASRISYTWTVNDSLLLDPAYTMATLSNYQGINQTNKTYVFKRYATDDSCNVSLSKGVYTIEVRDPISQDAIVSSTATYCDRSQVPDSIYDYATIGGVGVVQYRWSYQVNGGAVEYIASANNQRHLGLSQIVFEADKTYSFRREYLANDLDGQWHYSDGVYTVMVRSPFSSGSIQSDTMVFVGAPSSVTVKSVQPAVGGNASQITYQWFVQERGLYLNSTPDFVFSDFSGAAETLHIRRLASDMSCVPVDSLSGGEAVVIVLDTLYSGALVDAGTHTYCFGSWSDDTIFASQPTGVMGSYEYDWQCKKDGGVYISTGITTSYMPLGKMAIEAGHQYSFIRLVTDSGHLVSPIQSAGIYEVIPFASFDAGAIESRTDTLYGSQTITINSQSLATGGDGDIAYSWTLNGQIIPNESSSSLTYSLTNAGTYVFNRLVRDGQCNTTPTISAGTYQVEIVSTLDAGMIGQSVLYCCDTTAFHTQIIRGTPATGGKAPYTYLWYVVVQGVETLISQSMTPDLTLDNVYAMSGHSYEFIRKVKDSAHGSALVTSSGSTTIYVYHPFGSGSIVSRTDTMVGVPQSIVVSSLTPATGGDGKYTYIWNLNGQTVLVSPYDTLHFTAQSLGTYTFTRYAADSTCQTTALQSLGQYTIHIVDTFRSGMLTDTVRYFCDHASAHAYTIPATLATGGLGNYSYQWYNIDSQGQEVIISGETGATMSLQNYVLQSGQSYTFVRKATDNSSLHPLTLSSGKTIVHVRQQFDAGSIVSRTDTMVGVPQSIVVSSLSPATGGEGKYTYTWDLNGQTILVSPYDTLHFTAQSLGTYTFTRYAADSTCQTTALQSLGQYTIHIVDTFRSGMLTDTVRYFCDHASAHAYTIPATLATGGSGNYSYQWYNIDSQGQEVIISGETSATMSLQNYVLQSGQSYTFVRKATDNSSLHPLTLSSGKTIVHVRQKFDAGSIVSRTDTMVGVPQSIVVSSLSPATGGDGKYTYTWDLNGQTILVSPYDTLHFTAQSLGTYTFTRYAADSTCQTTALQSLGQYTIHIVDTFRSGMLTDTVRYFCDLVSAHAYTIPATLATGGSGNYSYQWYNIDSQGQEVIISGETSATMSLQNYVLQSGQSYTFVRKATDNSSLYPLTLSSGMTIVNVGLTFDAGSIVNKIDTLVGVPQAIGISSLMGATGGDGRYVYTWDLNGQTILVSKLDTLSYSITQPGSYTFTRYAADSTCQTAALQSLGQYTILVVDTFRSGMLTDTVRYFCDLVSAHAYTIPATLATGGTGNYSYQWYNIDSQGQEVIISGETGATMSLQNYVLQSGQSYTFVRKATDNSSLHPLTLSSGMTVVNVGLPFNSGSIVSQAITLVGVPQTVTISSQSGATGGDGRYIYTWDLNGQTVLVSKSDTLSYPITQPGTYTFTRYAADSTCQTAAMLSQGQYMVTVYSPLQVGSIQDTYQIFCDTVSAHMGVVFADLPTGGSGQYRYQWYCIQGTDTLPVYGATSADLYFRSYAFTAGQSYQFVRRVEDAQYPLAYAWTAKSAVIEIFETFNPGRIEQKVDTLVGLPCQVNVNNLDSASGGDASVISYQWYANGQPIPGATGVALNNYIIRQAGTYVFSRQAMDNGCLATPMTAKNTYTVLATEVLNAGGFVSDSLSFCSVAMAQNYVVKAQPATGGTGRYQYQWYMIQGNDTNAISGATGCDLQLDSTYVMMAGSTYRLIRYAADSLLNPVWTLSSGTFVMNILYPFDAGSLLSERDTFFVGDTFSIRTLPATGGGVKYYSWKQNGKYVPGQSGADLTQYVISKPGIYTFSRESWDNMCQTSRVAAHGIIDSLGVDSVFIVQPVYAGVIASAKYAVCNEADAQALYIKDTIAPKYGLGNYFYQWYCIVDATDTLLVSGENQPQLSLSSIQMPEGHTYTYLRMVRDEFYRTPWKQSSGLFTVKVYETLDAGSIHADKRTHCWALNDYSVHSISIMQDQAGTGDVNRQYQWLRINPGVDTIVVGTAADLVNYDIQPKDVQLGVNYLFVRQVRNPGCVWTQSIGQVEYAFGQVTNKARQIHCCRSALPYTFTWTDQYGTTSSHTFTQDGEIWTISTPYALCQADSIFQLKVVEPVVVNLHSADALCYNNHTLQIDFDIVSGSPDMFHIVYGNALAAAMGRNDTVGLLTTSTAILIHDVPQLGFGKYDMTIEIFNKLDFDAGNLCGVASYSINAVISDNTFVLSKYDKVLFVNNSGNTFLSYQWYKDGRPVDGATSQYYDEQGAILYGSYYVTVVDNQGIVHRSCEVQMPTSLTAPLPERAAVYPVPVRAKAPLTIQANQSTAQIWTLQGGLVKEVEFFDGEKVIEAPTLQGVYIVRIANQNGETTDCKLIVE